MTDKEYTLAEATVLVNRMKDLLALPAVKKYIELEEELYDSGLRNNKPEPELYRKVGNDRYFIEPAYFHVVQPWDEIWIEQRGYGYHVEAKTDDGKTATTYPCMRWNDRADVEKAIEERIAENEVDKDD